MRELDVRAESWPIAGGFAISRGSKADARVVVAEIRDDAAVGRGECVPYARYGETVEGVLEVIQAQRGEVERGLTQERLRELLAPGAARNALDCALWDYRAKRAGCRVWELASLPEPAPLVTAYTISLGSPDAMAAAARAAATRPLLKLKLGREGIVERTAAVRGAAPAARLIVDANEAWSPAELGAHGASLAELGVELIEQPVPEGEEDGLANVSCPVPLCADESFRDIGSLRRLRRFYASVNVKLDKAGGLTEALAAATAARDAGFGLMIGCMVGTSLAMAPAALLGGMAQFVDLDGPLLLAQDREPGIRYEDSVMHPPSPQLWG